MSNMRKTLLLALVGVVFTSGAVGCKSSGKAAPDEQRREQREGEHPKGDHPKH